MGYSPWGHKGLDMAEVTEHTQRSKLSNNVKVTVARKWNYYLCVLPCAVQCLQPEGVEGTGSI